MSEKHLCKKCGEIKEVNETFWYRCRKTKSGFDLTKCKVCAKKRLIERQLRIQQESFRKAQKFTEFDKACWRQQLERAIAKIPSIYKDVL